MASYFVACDAEAEGAHAVHDRSRCAPGCFPTGQATEYLGEFHEAAQAIAVARLRYPVAHACPCCQPVRLPLADAPVRTPALSALRS